MPGPMPLKASALSLLGAVLRQPDGEKVARRHCSLTTPPTPSDSLRPYVLRWGWKERNSAPQMSTIAAPWPGFIHSKSGP